MSMKIRFRYRSHGKTVERTINNVPFRYIFALSLTIAGILAVIGAVAALCLWVPHFYKLAWVVEIVCVIRIIASDDNPDYKVPWLLFVLILPIAGFMLYFMFYSRKLKPRFVRRLHELRDNAYHKDDSALMAELKQRDKIAFSHAKLLTDIADAHVFTNTRQQYYRLGEEMYPQLLHDLRQAERFIYIESFIIEKGVFWDSVLAVLRDKVAQGVEVKVLYDDMGCMLTLPGDYYRTLRSYGIEANPFSMLRGNADSEVNNRNHRKITVIDGKIGYTGGINYADEYIGAVIRFGKWKDTAIRLEGEAVWELTKLFLIDFGINVKQMPSVSPKQFPEQPQLKEPGFLVPFGDGPRPIYERRVGKSVIQNLVASATDYLYMTTPYLIIDNDLCQDIENAALRGVTIKIITPHIPDKKIVFEMTRSYYHRLMAAGVEIYEYEPGFIHAKSYLADDRYGMIGTINLDYRSLVHHFENGVWMYDCACLTDLKQDIEETLEQCIRITPPMLKTTLFQRFFRAVVRIFAPML